MLNLDKNQKKIIHFFESVTQSSNLRQQVLFSLAELFNLEHSTFFLVNSHGKLVEPVMLNVDSKSVSCYMDYYQEKDIFHPHNLPPKKSIQTPIMYITDVMPLKKYEQTEYYNDFIKTQGFYHEMTISLSLKGKLLGGIGLYKPEGEGFGPEVKASLELLDKFLSGLLSKYLALQQATASQQLYQYCINKNPIGVIIFDENYSIIFSNDAASELASTLFQKKLNLQQFVEYVFSLSGASCRSPQVTLLNLYSPSLKEFSVKIIPVDKNLKIEQQTYLMKLVPGNIELLEGRLEGHLDEKKPSGINMKEQFNLTNREVEVLSLILKGLTNKEVAQCLFISPSTVKAHLRSILKKTGTDNRLRLYQKINTGFGGN